MTEVLDRDRAQGDPSTHANALSGRSIALIFEKPSTRTRVSFEVGSRSSALARSSCPRASSSWAGETIEDTGRVLSRYVDGIVLRTFEQERLELLTTTATVPVVNALSDFEHPCQALADLLTIREHLGAARRPRPRVLRGREQRRALAAAGRHEGRDDRRVATPAGFEPIPQVVHRAEEIADETGGTVELTHDPDEAAIGAHAPTPTSGPAWDRTRGGRRALVFPSYQLSQKLVDLAGPRRSCSTACRPTAGRRSPTR